MDSCSKTLLYYVAKEAYNGYKSSATGIDIEVNINNTRYLISVKSGPNWSNSSQSAKMEENFRAAKQKIGSKSLHVTAVNGCCYGKKGKPNRGSHLRLCGQEFWEFISGDPNLYVDLIEPLGHQAKQLNEDFLQGYSALVNRFTRQFTEDFCDTRGNIDWVKLLQFNSGRSA